MQASEYRQLRYSGSKPSAQQLKKWIEDGYLPGEIRAGMYFVDLQAALTDTPNPLLANMTKNYQDGHVEKGIEYLEVEADLAF